MLELIQDADANATIIQGWYTPFLDTLTDAINTIKIDTDTFFTNLESNASKQISLLAQRVETAEFGSSFTAATTDPRHRQPRRRPAVQSG